MERWNRTSAHQIFQITFRNFQKLLAWGLEGEWCWHVQSEAGRSKGSVLSKWRYAKVAALYSMCEFLLLNVHGSEKACYGRGRVGKGDRRVKPQNRRQPRIPRLPWTAARTTGCAIRNVNTSGIAQRPPHHAIAVPTAMQNRVTETMSVAPPLGNDWNKRSPTLSLAQHHQFDLFWASFFVRVQLTSLLLI